MKRYYFIMCAICTIFVYFSCSNEVDEMENRLSENFSTEDISAIGDFCKCVESTKKSYSPTARKFIKRIRKQPVADEVFTADEEKVAREELSKLGEQSIELFTKIGLNPSELNTLLPLKEKELYGIIGLEIYEEMDLEDMVLIGDKTNGYQIVERVDKDKAKNCLLSVLGIDMLTVTDLMLQESMTKKAMKNIITQVIKKVATRWATLAAGGTVGIAILVAEWTVCYFTS